MSRIHSWNRSLSRIELDQRSREAHLRLEQIEWLLLPDAAVRQFRLRRFFATAAAATATWSILGYLRRRSARQ
jgi:hypothetical protein